MNNFLPERIYQKVKELPEYQAIDTIINLEKDKCEDIVDFILSDMELSEKLTDEKNTLEKIIRETCPEYLLQYQMMHMETEAELLAAQPQDFETRLTQYQELFSLMKPNFEYWIEMYLMTYNPDVKMSAKMHLEYLLFSGHMYRKRMRPTDTMIEDYVSFIDKIVDEIKDKCPYDTLMQMRLRQIAAFINDMARVMKNDIKVASMLSQTKIDLPYFDKEDFSYHTIEILDRLYDINFSARNFELAYKYAKDLEAYVNYGLQNKSKLISGLNFYDFNYATPFLTMVYKYRRISEEVPALDIQFVNLTDKELTFFDQEYKYFRHATTNKFVNGFRGRMDKIVNGNKETYQVFNTWIEGRKTDGENSY